MSLWGWDTSHQATCSCLYAGGRTPTTRCRRSRAGRPCCRTSRPVPAAPARALMTPARPRPARLRATPLRRALLRRDPL